MGRSLQHLLETISHLQQRAIGFKSLTENIDTTTPGGKLIFRVLGALAEFERDLSANAHKQVWQPHGHAANPVAVLSG